MMKRFYISLIALMQCTMLFSHGFGTDTLVLLASNSWQHINTVCYRAQKKKILVASYDTTSSLQTTAQVIRGGRSQTSCYIQFGFEARINTSQHQHGVVSTPTQEFYNASTRDWVPAYMLKIGDALLCANNVIKTVAYISLIKESLPIYTIQVKQTHTFFVTQDSVLTHNMVIPLAFNAGLSIPFGAAAGGTVGSFFGPATLAVGTAIGCMVGILAKVVCSGSLSTYAVEDYNTHAFEYHAKQQPQLTLNEPLFSTTMQNPTQTIIGCSDPIPQQPHIFTTPAEPIPVLQNSGYRPLSDEDRKELSGDCALIPIPASERGSPIVCGGVMSVPVDVSSLIMTTSIDDAANERYKGPIYIKTEDWVKNSPMGTEFERTNKGFQGKRAFKLKKSVPGITGISEGDHVVIDAAHGDHLEVYNERGKWTHVANFDGSKNAKKTEQGKDEPRKPLQIL